jgi:tetratricopeptide (TPR) repeat protein
MEGGNELREIKKEIIEARGLIIKSNNLASSLNTEVRSIGKRQASYERHFSLGSIVSYIVVAIVAWAGIQLAYGYRQSALENALRASKEEAGAAKKELAELQKQSTGTSKGRAEARLLDLYALVHEGDKQAAIEAYDALDHSSLTPVEAKLFADAIDEFRGELSMQHYTAGLDLSTKGKYAEAVEELRLSLRYKENAGHSKAAQIELANALRLQGKPREAIAVLQKLVEERLDRDLADDAYWYLALANEEAHQRDEARSALRALMRQFPDSQYFRDARIKVADIEMHLKAPGQ